MKNLFATLIFVILVTGSVISAGSEQQSDFYVAPGGSDKNLGTIDKPFATLAKARDAVRGKLSGQDKDIVVMLRGGDYLLDETVVFGLEDSGRGEHKVIYRNYPNEEPVFSSAVKVAGWKKGEGKLWVADAPKQVGRFYTLYEGETRLARARSEAFAATKDFGLQNEGVPFEPDYVWPPRDELHFPKGAMKNWENLDEVELLVRPNQPWIMNILTLGSVDEKSLIAKTEIPGSYPFSPRKDNKWCWIENHLDYLNEPGEWVLTGGKIYLWHDGKGSPENIVVPLLREFIRVEGKIDKPGPVDVPVRNIVFKGLTFTCGARDKWTKDDVGIAHDWEMYDKGNALLRFRGAENCVIEECQFRNSSGTGIRLDLHCQGNVIRNNWIRNLGGTGILLSGYGPGTKDVNKNNQVLNNRIHDCGEIYWHNVAILLFQSGENRVANNLIYNMPYQGISVCGIRPHFFDAPFKPDSRESSRCIRFDETGEAKKWHHILHFMHSRANIIELNEIHSVMRVLGDGNAIYITATGPFNVIRRNYLHDISGAVAVIRTDGWQKDTLITENIIYKCSGGIARKNYNHVENNIIADLYKPAAEKDKGTSYIGFVSFPMDERTVGARVGRNICYDLRGFGRFYVQRKFPRAFTKIGDTQTDFNIFYNKVKPEAGGEFIAEMNKLGIDEHSISADPLFVDLENGDFRLRPKSPALKMGFKQIDVTKMGLTKDFPEKFRN